MAPEFVPPELPIAESFDPGPGGGKKRYVLRPAILFPNTFSILTPNVKSVY
jgi:hypothetical protein